MHHIKKISLFFEQNLLNFDINKINNLYLIDKISCSDNQEIGSHTFSHFYCKEGNQKIEEFKLHKISFISL